ncbi:DMT family transporter [Cardiobacteriaceae bacterium TAE3-ERU3]|nr:DMT family transporter [Cardiobacteriaceae bacterium TAE3-ERU3]
MNQEDHLGMILRVGATLLFTLMVVCIKYTTVEFPVSQVVFFRSFFALIPLLVFVFLCKEFKTVLKPQKPFSVAMMCAMACMATFTSFLSLRYINIAESTIIGYLTPIMTAVLAIFILKEAVNRVRWISIILGFVGILILIIPGIDRVNLDGLYLYGIGLAVVTAILTAGSKIQAKFLSSNESAATMALYFALTCSAFAAFIGFMEGWLIASIQQICLLVGAGILGGTAHIMMYSAFKYSDASKLAGLEFLGLPFSIIADFVFFNIIPDGVFYFSAALILSSSIYLAVFDRHPQKKHVQS